MTRRKLHKLVFTLNLATSYNLIGKNSFVPLGPWLLDNENLYLAFSQTSGEGLTALGLNER